MAEKETDSVPHEALAGTEDARTNVPENAALPRIRTYAADMSRAIKERGESLSSIITAEKKRPRRAAKNGISTGSSRRMFLAFGALTLVALGIGIVAGAMFFLGGRNEPPDISQGLVFANRTVTVTPAPNELLDERLAALRAGLDLSLGEVARVVVLENGVELPPLETALQLGLPASFAREVEDIMVGIHAFDRSQPFLLITVSAFDRSLGALLANETTLGKNLGTFFAPLGATNGAPSLTFEDAVIRNIDVRQSTHTSDGTAWPILYAYPARTTVIITTNEFTLREVLTRLGARQ
ncbi:MAG: hypothetical protein ACE5F4_00145 [Candidatus Paceibacteria bacterium]